MTHPESSGSSPSRSTGHVPSAPMHAASHSHASTSQHNASAAPRSTPTSVQPATMSAAASSSSAAAASHTAPSIPATSSNVKVLPYLFDDAQIDDVLVLVVDMLVRLTDHNDSLPLHPSALTRFHSRATPNISLSAYLRRIAKYTSIEKCCVLILLVYIDRVCERLEGFTICGLTVHRFICAAILCASKALCDAFNTNEHYAKVGGISLQEINLLEKEFLQIIDWRLICGGAELQHYYASLVRNHKDYVLDEPKNTQQQERISMGMEIDTVEGHGNGSANGHASPGGKSGIAPPVLTGVAATAQAASVHATPAIGSSQHSSPFPVSSNNSNSSTSHSPFTPSSVAVNGSGGLGAVASSSSSSSSGSRRAGIATSSLSTSTSPITAMQVDPATATSLHPASAATATSRRRKDEHRTPPSPRSQSHTPAIATSAGGSIDAVHSNGHASSAHLRTADATSANSDAFKRTRFDGPQP
ncbi:PHO85 cyclin PHO80 [Pseudozyma hubeiensis]|nr:PHO85 cyclin PHO80 [Pseudozyma hubeiensis]